MDVLIALVIATFIIAGVYVGYHYSQDPANFEAHDIDHAVLATVVTTPMAPMAATVVATDITY